MFVVSCAASVATWFLPQRLKPHDVGDLSDSDSSSIRPVAILVSGDTSGWIVPCGCTSNQSGGLLRRGTFVADQRRDGETIVVDAGGAPAGTSRYDRVKFEAILRGERAMGVAVHNLGGPEAALGIDYLKVAAKEIEAPFVSANLRDAAGRLVVEPSRIVVAGGRRIAFLGVLSPKFATKECRIDEPREAILATLAALDGKCDATVVLAHLPEPELRELAAALPEVDAVVGGPTGQAIAPEKVGPALLAAATNKGKFLVRLQVPVEKKTAWTGDVVEMTGRFADDPQQADVLASFRRELESLDLAADETGLVASTDGSLSADLRVAGSAACAECHVDEDRAWRESSHAHAWDTLTKTGAHVDAACQRCHTTGFGATDGFVSAKRSLHHTAVGCESCHGPSQAHVLDAKTRTPFAAADRCTTCHDRENSPGFEYAAYWSKIVHGPAPRTSARHDPRRDPP